MNNKRNGGNIIPFPSVNKGHSDAIPSHSVELPKASDIECSLGRKELTIDQYLVREMEIAFLIQNAFGTEEANAWVQFHREFINGD